MRSSIIVWCSLLASARVAMAATVDCERGDRVAEAVKNASAGERIVISGTCRENVVVPASAQNLTLDGQDHATLLGADDSRPVILVLGREIGIRHLRLSGGRNGINVLRGASANVDGVTIDGTGKNRTPGSGLGINIGQHAFASVINSSIRNNWSVGILVHENSGARIGFVDVATIVGKNDIAENGIGILVTESAQARVVGATISHNRQDGIRVERGSQLEFADNDIEDNGGSGVAVKENSGAIVEIGAGTSRKANRTRQDAANSEFGVACSVGGYVAGSVGSLSGRKGTASISANCTNALGN